MKSFKASDFARNPKPVYAEARSNGVIIQKCNTNGKVEEGFVLIPMTIWNDCEDLAIESTKLSNIIINGES